MAWRGILNKKMHHSWLKSKREFKKKGYDKHNLINLKEIVEIKSVFDFNAPVDFFG